MTLANDKDTEVLWRCASRFHDWADLKFPQRLLTEAATAGIVGPPEWLERDPGGPREPLGFGDPSDFKDAARFAAGLFAAGYAGRAGGYLHAGGSAPHPWALWLTLSTFDPEEGRVGGYNMLSLRFPRAPFEGPRRSAALLDCFTRTHTPGDTEFAAVHPARRWELLRTSLYDVAVTYDPMFAGVLWANFLGPGHVEQFDRAALDALTAYRVEWVGTRGLFLVVTPDLADADTPPAEREMQRLTEIFRRARRA